MPGRKKPVFKEKGVSCTRPPRVDTISVFIVAFNNNRNIEFCDQL